MQIISTNVDARLLDTVKFLKGAAGSHYALHFHTSSLQEMYRSEFQQRIAVNIMNDIFRKEGGEIFAGRDGDIVVLYHGLNKDLLSQAIFQLRYMFADDPLAYHGEGQENENFCTLYDLAFQWRPFHRVCSERVTLATQLESQVKTPKPEEEKGLLTPSRLVNIIEELDGVDFSYAMRRQPVCAIQKNRQIKPVFHEMYVNMVHLRKLLSTDCNLASDKWLFRHLTDVLDAHVLELLTEHARQYLSQPVSLNLNVQTVLGDVFRRFRDRAKQESKAAIVVEIHIADVFTDMDAFLRARNLLHEAGYRLCLDGLTNESFVQVDREALGFDLAKLQWNADMVGDLANAANKKLAEAVKRCGSNRMILCRCDSEHAIDYGHALGISLYQGRYPDRVLNPSSMVIN